MLWLVGGVGTGKASLIKSWAAEQDWELFVITPDVYSCGKEVVDQLFKVANTQSFLNAFEGKTRTRAALIDDLDVFASMDRGFFGAIAESFRQMDWRGMPVIGVGNVTLEKRLRDLKKGTVLKLISPANDDITQWAGGAATPTQITECQGNMAYLRMLVKLSTQAPQAQAPQASERSSGRGGGRNSGRSGGRGGGRGRKNQTTASVAHEQTIDRALGLGNMFCDPPLPRHVLRHIMLDDPWFHPLRFHENTVAEMAHRRGSGVNKLRVYAKLIDTLIAWDTIVAHDAEMAADVLV